MVWFVTVWHGIVWYVCVCCFFVFWGTKTSLCWATFQTQSFTHNVHLALRPEVELERTVAALSYTYKCSWVMPQRRFISSENVHAPRTHEINRRARISLTPPFPGVHNWRRTGSGSWAPCVWYGMAVWYIWYGGSAVDMAWYGMVLLCSRLDIY